ncbi:microtubule-associated protein futsch isoform X2 [Brachypodium distachyon]|uniref:glutathione transferase n=1 Tax=Brachypodium distachyon TaxID=15368 RepID=A0A2K2CSP1_BRADI|nr:microtubule-associated protein futsch isoform X2 [Brachypodium distachyon]PNT65049.1 hypothetical protein BRADI_4g36890v3 [Brachypodium distachyon]|eukprot:XP_014758373.1 microtubule-associated protein futsch isoform X2 [Brachypodium distachyon]
MAGLSTGAPIVRVYHEKSMILPDVSRVLACLYEKDIKFETHTASSYKSLLRLQASNHAPVPFYDGHTFLEESREICRYIAETYEHHGYPFLLGKDSLERASIEQWLHHEEHAFNPPSRSLFCHLAFPLDEEDDGINLQKRKLEEVLEVYEQRLGDSEFLAGNKFTLADLVHLPNSYHITESEEFVYLYDSRKNVQRWWNAISTRDSWQNVLKDIKKVVQQHRQEELEKQQWLREHPTTTRLRSRLDSRKHTSTKSQTILVPPVGIISTYPMAPRAEKPRPTKISTGEAQVSSSLSTPSSRKSSAARSKHPSIFTTHQETPPASVQGTFGVPEKPPMPVQRRSNFFMPATSPTTSDKKPSRNDADISSTTDVSLPSKATEIDLPIDLPTKSKPSSFKEAPNNLHVFDFYKASSHTDETEPYIKPTPQRTSEMLDKISETGGPRYSTNHAKTSPRSAKEDPEQLSASSFYKTDSTTSNAESQDKGSVSYTERTLQKSSEIIYGRSADQGASYTSGKPHSAEAHQKLLAEQWHAATAGLSNLKRETDHLIPTQQVKPSTDVQQNSSPNSEQPNTRPLAQEPVIMDGQLVEERPEMTTPARYTGPRRDVSSVLWQQAADVRRIAEEDDASSDPRGAERPPYTRKHTEEANIVSADRRKYASVPKRVTDEAPQGIPFQTAYDERHETTQEARETASAQRERRAKDAHDSSEGIGTYHSASSGSQPSDAPGDDRPPPKQAAFEGPRRATAPQSGPQELIIQARETPALRPTVPHDAQGSTEEETVDASSSKSQLLDSHRADARPPMQFSDEAIAPLQTGYTDAPYNRKRDRETAAPKQMMAEDDAPQQKLPPAEDPQTTTPFKKRYSAAEGTTRQSKLAASRTRKMAAQEVQDNFEESKAGDFWSPRERPSDNWRARSPLPSHEVNDARSMIAPSQKRYPDTRGNTKEVEDISSMPRQMAGEDAKETKNSESASSRAEPLDYQRTEAPSRKQEAIEDPRGATSPFEIRYAAVQDTTKHPRDTVFKPSKMVVQDAHGTSEEAEARKSASFREQPPDAWQSAITPSKQPADEDTLSLSRPSPTRYPRAEETRKQPRAAASIPTHIAAQDARDVLRKSNVADFTSSEEQPSDAQAAISFPKQEVSDARGTTVPVQKRYSDTKGTTKKAKVTFEEAKTHDSASSQVQPLDSQRADATEDPLRATSPLKKRHYVEGTTKQSRENAFKPRKNVDQDAQGTDGEPKAGDSAFTRKQPSDTWQASNTPTGQVPTQDDPRLTLPSEVISDEHNIKHPRRTGSTRRRISPQDAADTFQDSKPADSMSSREQPLSAWQPAVTPPTQEIKDSHSTTSAFRKTSPYVEDRTRPAKPTYTPRTALPVSKQAKAEEDAQDKGIENRETISAPNTVVYRDAQDTYGERKTTGFTSRDSQGPIKVERPPSVYQEDPLVAQDGREQAQTLPAMRADGSTQKRRQAPVVPSTSEDKPTPQAPPRAKVHDGHSTEEPFKSDSVHDHKEAPLLFGQGPTSQVQDATELLQEAPDGDMSSKSSTIDQWRRTSVPLQDVTSNSDDEVLGVSTIDQEPTPMSQQPIPSARGANEMIKRPVEQIMVPPAPARAQTTDVQKRRQDPVVTSSSEEKPTPQALSGAKVHDGHRTEEPFKRDSVHDHKEEPLLFGQEPTSQVQHATELLQETPDGDMSSKSSTIDQWRRTSVPLQDVTSNSGDDVLGVSTVDQKPTPKIQEPAPARAQKTDVRRAPPSFPGADRAEGAGQVQMQAVDGRATSVPTRKATREIGDQEFVDTSDGQRSKAPEAKYDSAIHEYVPDASLSTHGATVGDKTTFNASEAQGSETRPGSTETPVNDRPTSDDELVGRFLRDQGSQPPESTQTQKPVEAPRDSVSIQDVPNNALDTTKISKPTLTESMTLTTTLEAQLAEQKFAPSDKKSARAAEPLSFVESRNGDITVSAADQNKTPQTIFRHQVRPPTPITREVPSSDTQHNARKIQQVTLDNLPTDDSPMPFVPSHEQVSHAQQTIPSKKHTTPAPGARDSPALDSQPTSAKVQEVIPDNYDTDGLTGPFASTEKQGPWPDAHDVLDDGDKIKSPFQQSPVLEYKSDATPTDSYVHPTSGDVPRILLDQGAESPTTTESTNPKDQPIPASTHHIPANALFNLKKPGPLSPEQEAISSTPDQASHLEAESDSAMSEVLPAAKKFAPSDQDSVHAAQQPSPAEARKEQTVAAVEQTLPAIVGQKHTQDMRKAPTSDSRNGRPDEVTFAEQRFTPKDQDTQSTSSAEPHNEDSKDPARSTKPLFPAAPDQTKDSQTTISQQDIAPSPGTSKSTSSGTQHASGKFEKVAPEDHIVESIRNQGEASRVKPALEPSKAPSRDASSMIYEDRMRAPSSQAQSSDPNTNSTQNIEPSARLLPNQVAQPHTESEATPPFMGIYDSKSTQDVIEDNLGNVKSLEPSSMDQEATASALTPYTDLGSAPGEIAPARQRSLLKDQDSALSAQKSSSSEPMGDHSTVSAHNQHKVSQTIIGQQDIAPTPTKMKDPSSTPDPHGAIVEESMAHTTSPALSTHGQHDQDSDHQAQPRASDRSREQERHVDQTIVQQRIFGHQVIEPSPGKRESSAEVLEVGPGDHRPSELIKPLIPSRKQDSYIGYPDAHGAVADERTPPPLVSPAHGLDAGLNSAPATASDDVIPTSSDEPVTGPVHGHENKLPAAFQASLTPEAPHDSIYPKNVAADALGDVEPLEATSEVTPADQNMVPSEPLSVIESRKEESTVAEAKESAVSQPVIGQQDIRLPSISEPVIDDDHNKEPVSREEQVSHSQRASEPHEGSPPDVHGTFVDKMKTPRSSLEKSSDAIPDALRTSLDVDPTSGEQPTTRFLRDQGAQLPATTKSAPYPESNQVVPKSSQPPSADQEVLSPTVVPSSAPDSQLGAASDEIAPDEQKISLSAQDLPRTTQPRLSVEPTKEKTVIAASNQTNEARIIISQQGKTPSADKERTPFDFHASELAKPLDESQEQAPHDGSAYEQRKGPTPDVYGVVDEKMPLPSRNSDTRPDSARISGDARHTSGGGPATSSIHDSQAQSPAGPIEALGGPKIINNVHDDFLEKIKSPRPPSTDQELMTHMTSPAPAPDAPQDQDSVHSTKLSPSVVSRKDFANADQENVSQAGLREPTSSDTTRPSEKTQEFSPDAYLTKSENPLLPMKGIDPSHRQDSSTPQTIPDQEGTTHASGTRDSPPSDTQLASAKVQEVVPDNYADELTFPFVSSEKQDTYAGSSTEPHEGPSPDAHGAVADKDITKSPSREATVLEAGPGSTPTDSYVRPTSNDEPGIMPDQRKESPTAVQATYGQASEFNAQPDSAMSEVDPASKKFALSEPLSVVESRKEESRTAEAVESKVSQPVVAQKDIRHVPGISGPVLDDDRNKEPVSREEQVSHGHRDSEPCEGSPPDVHGTFVNKEKTPPSSQAKSSDATPDLLDPSSSEQATTRILHDQGAQLPARIKSPLYSGSNQVVPKSLEAPATDQEVLSPTVVPASTPDSPFGTASDEIAPAKQNLSLSAQDLARSAQPTFSVEATKEETIVAASDQTNEARTVVGRQGIMPAADKEKTQFALHASGSAKSLSGSQEQVPHAGNAYEQREGPPPDVPGAVDEKISLPSSQAQNSENRPVSAPVSADAHRTRGDGPATSSSRDSQEQPPAGTQALPVEASGGTEIIQSVPAGFLEKIESPRPLSDHEEFIAPMDNPVPVPDASQAATPHQDSTHSAHLSPSVVSREHVADADQTNVSQASSSLDAVLSAAGLSGPTHSDTTRPSGKDPVQSPDKASFDLTRDEKTTMIKGDQARTISNVSLSASQAVGQSESGAVKGASEDLVSSSSQNNLKGTSNGEKSMEQQQTDQSSTRSSKDDGIQTSGTARPNILTESGDAQPSLLKESMNATEESSKNQEVDRAVFQSIQDSKRQLEETEAQDTGTNDAEETNFHQNMNPKNNGSSQRNALEQPGEPLPGVQLRSNNTNNGSKPTKDVPSSIQADDKSERNLRTSEESKQQIQMEDKTKGGETKAVASKTEQPEERDPPSSNKSITSQSQAEPSKNLEEQASSSIQNRDTNSSKLDGSTDDMKSGNMEDNSSA